MELSPTLHQRAATLRKILSQPQRQYAPILPSSFTEEPPFIFNFTETNNEVGALDVTNTSAFEQYVTDTLKRARTLWGVGGYGEDRIVYRSPLFVANGQARTVHLAVDLWIPAGTQLFAPIDGVVHSVQDNDHLLDYGPTIILQHMIEEVSFFTLYGHCSRSSLIPLTRGHPINAGMPIATVGKSDENGHWPPHLHFQIILDLLGKHGDFPGVAKAREKKFYLTLCPDPNLILHIPSLEKI